MRIFGIGNQDPALAHRIAEVREAEQKRRRHDLIALEQGGLPLQATERLRKIGSASDSYDTTLFTSNLAPDEAALLRREGFRLRSLVSGSAMYHVGRAYASTQGDCEVTVLSDAYNQATQLAVSRMREELRLIGAHGVIGVRLALVRHEWADKTVEVQLLGTAIEGPGRPPAEPWMCDLSGQEWWALHRAGYEPVGLVWGHCTWFILTTYDDETIKSGWVNRELTHWSEALSAARHRAMAHLMTQARQHGAAGIAGVKFERRRDEIYLSGGQGAVYMREHHNLAVSIIGTGIRPRPGAATRVTPTVPVLSLLDGRLSPIARGSSSATIK
jgi:uncharacterized protein YbjQ (UPF0145 family)